MNARWAVRLPPEGSSSAANLRLEPGIEILEQRDGLWLRGSDCDERLEARLRMLPGAVRYDVLSDGQLRPAGKRLPQGRLPAGIWEALNTWAQVELPLAKLAAQSISRIPVRLERTAVVAEADCLATVADEWLAWGQIAPQVRLERLTFAASSDGRIIVRGRPLPPVTGERFYERSGLILPCGWGWPDWLDAVLVREALDLPEADLALFSRAGTWELIQGDEFVRATRSAVRLSVAERVI
jgi:hypothetical protein